MFHCTQVVECVNCVNVTLRDSQRIYKQQKTLFNNKRAYNSE